MTIPVASFYMKLTQQRNKLKKKMSFTVNIAISSICVQNWKIEEVVVCWSTDSSGCLFFPEILVFRVLLVLVIQSLFFSW
jgi:hypothetical protein